MSVNLPQPIVTGKVTASSVKVDAASGDAATAAGVDKVSAFAAHLTQHTHSQDGSAQNGSVKAHNDSKSPQTSASAHRASGSHRHHSHATARTASTEATDATDTQSAPADDKTDAIAADKDKTDQASADTADAVSADSATSPSTQNDASQQASQQVSTTTSDSDAAAIAMLTSQAGSTATASATSEAAGASASATATDAASTRLAKPDAAKPAATKPALPSDAFAKLMGGKTAKASDDDQAAANDDSATVDGQANAKPDSKDALSRAGSVLDAFKGDVSRQVSAHAQAASNDAGRVLDTNQAQSQTPAQSQAADATTQTAPAFALQAQADTQGSYTSAGASTASASNLSRATVENLSAMSVQINKKLSEGNTKFAMELHPADLGKVQVTLTIGRDGETKAHLQFDTPVTASAFSAHADELRNQLSQSGLNVAGDALTFSSSQDGGGFGSAFADAQGQQQQSQGQGHSAQAAARALQAAGQAADTTDLSALDASLGAFRGRTSSTLALNLIV